jgi:hypothetical protein
MPRHRLATLPALAMLAVVLAACASAQAPIASFDPSAPCPAEGQQPGAYPDLEALLPTTHEGEAPDSLDSGRMCTEANLGTLAAAGIDEVRYGGATWHTGGTSGLTVAVFTAEGLDAATMLQFYETPARAARRTEELRTLDTTVGGVPAKRLDVLSSDGTGQTIVTWQPAADGPVWVLLAADIGDTKVEEVLATFGEG